VQDQSKIIKLSPEELETQLETVLNFLSIVHPSLISEDGSKPCVELRPIIRGEYDHKLQMPCNIWDLSEKSVSRIRTFLKRHNGAPTCLFYSVFTYDNNMKTRRTDGTLAKPGRITNESAVDTSEVVLDFDHIGFKEYTDLVDRFEDIGLYALWVSTGHGFHAHFPLQEPLDDKGILMHLVHKFRAKGFDCDPACVDPARVMRLPGTFNKKYLKDKTYAAESANPPRCEIVQEHTDRYAIDFILDALEKLPTISLEDEAVYLKANLNTAGNGKSRKGTSENNNAAAEQGDVIRRIEYPYLAQYDLPEPIQRILSHTPHGFRNPCLGYLIKILKTHFKLGRSQILEILTLWSQEACDPPYDPQEFKTDFSRLYYNYNGLSYTTAMARKFGKIESEQLIKLRKQDIIIPNKLFRSLADLDGQAVRLYLGIKMLEHQKTTATQAALSELLNISTRAIRPTIQSLERSGFAYRVDGNRKLGIPFSYKTSKIVNRSDGYMTFSYNDIKAYVTELYGDGNRANGALKLFLFFRWKFYTHDIYMSQEKLGENIGVLQESISCMVSKLEELHFIRVTKVRRSIMESCEYTLLR